MFGDIHQNTAQKRTLIVFIKEIDICEFLPLLNTSSVQLSYYANKLISKGKQRNNVRLPIVFRYIVLFGLR